MNRAAAIVPSLIIVLMLALELLGLGEALEYRRAFVGTEPWRVLTGHFVHLSLVHALLNAVGLLLIARLFSDRLRVTELVAVLLVSSILISVAFLVMMPQVHWYRGLSGALHAVFFAGCLVWLVQSSGRGRYLPAAALAAGALKVLLEQPWDSSYPLREWLGGAVVPQAHLFGALAGLAAGLLLARHRHLQKRGQERQSG